MVSRGDNCPHITHHQCVVRESMIVSCRRISVGKCKCQLECNFWIHWTNDKLQLYGILMNNLGETKVLSWKNTHNNPDITNTIEPASEPTSGTVLFLPENHFWTPSRGALQFQRKSSPKPALTQYYTIPVILPEKFDFGVSLWRVSFSVRLDQMQSSPRILPSLKLT